MSNSEKKITRIEKRDKRWEYGESRSKSEPKNTHQMFKFHQRFHGLFFFILKTKNSQNFINVQVGPLIKRENKNLPKLLPVYQRSCIELKSVDGGNETT